MSYGIVVCKKYSCFTRVTLVTKVTFRLFPQSCFNKVGKNIFILHLKTSIVDSY